MQNNNTDNFDQLVKGMLADAQEEVPAGVWEAVSARIAAPAAAPKAGRAKAFWAFGGAALAAAAAAALVLVLNHGSASDSPVQVSPVATTQMVAEAQTVSEPIAPSTQPAAEQPSESQPASQQPVRKAVAAPQPQQTIAQPEPQPQAEVQAEPQSQQAIAESQPEHQAQPKASQPEEQPRQESTTNEWSDPFKAMEIADRLAALRQRSAGRLAFAASGNLASNGGNVVANTSRNGIVSSGAPAIPTETTITENSLSVYGVPVSFGLSAAYRITDRVRIASGVNYSLLSRTFSGDYTEVENGVVKPTISGEIYNELHYIGIPVNVYYHLVDKAGFNLYCFAGAEVEKGVNNKFVIDSNPKTYYNKSVPGVQASAAAGLGAQFNFTDHLGLYLDPSVHYYFNCDQPKSVRTQRPFMMTFEVGLRYNL